MQKTNIFAGAAVAKKERVVDLKNANADLTVPRAR